MGIEKRLFVRVRPHPRRPVTIQIIGKDFIDVFQVVDISIGGVGVRVAHRFDGCELDEEVELVLSLPGTRPMQTRGTIRHVRDEPGGSLFGLQFSELSSLQRDAIQSFVDHRLLGDDVLHGSRPK